MNPEEAISPKSRLEVKKPFICNTYKEGVSGGYTIARLVYEGRDVIGIRWNGYKEKDIGFPNSHGHGTWFILPKEVALAYVETITTDESIIKLGQATDDNPYER